MTTAGFFTPRKFLPIMQQFHHVESVKTVDYQCVPGTGRANLSGEALAAVQVRFKKVLVVDDSKFLADTLAMFFQLDGFSARAAYCGKGAMDVYDADSPDIAFIDISMPGIDGLAVARHVRASEQGKSTLLVALSGWERDTIKQEAEGAGFDYFMPKPVEPNSLRTFLSGLVCDSLTAD